MVHSSSFRSLLTAYVQLAPDACCFSRAIRSPAVDSSYHWPYLYPPAVHVFESVPHSPCYVFDLRWWPTKRLNHSFIPFMSHPYLIYTPFMSHPYRVYAEVLKPSHPRIIGRESVLFRFPHFLLTSDSLRPWSHAWHPRTLEVVHVGTERVISISMHGRLGCVNAPVCAR